MTRSTPPIMARRPALLAAAMLLLLAPGCDRVTETLGLTGNVAAVAPAPVGPERLRVTLPATGAEATLAPVARNRNATVWQTLDGITLTFREGVLAQTRGLGQDVMTSDVTNTLAMLRGAPGDGYYPQFRSYLDGEDRTVFRTYQCRRTGRTDRQVTIDQTPLRLHRIEETCTSPRTRFTNIYWLDGNGTVMKSRQWINPSIGAMETERVLR
ncbi:hypothetical protein DQW77_17250 [Roseovarius sp. TE539]|uniref:YjbF family lipoprotein n=1 Tax=Roseovarius sp. TE539 TaxID=2249812 RepID=UPI000DDD68AD|nr:YjbF family lipoprotein [Roseovarius sp. TE539]RBI67862.1 hypothetical protein DQW77_17250 [Roseovarius sp. TE539]